MEHLLDNDRMFAVQIGGVMMILAALICYFFVSERKGEKIDEELAATMEIKGERTV